MNKVYKVKSVPKVLKVIREIQELLVHKVLRETKVIKATPDHKVHRD